MEAANRETRAEAEGQGFKMGRQLKVEGLWLQKADKYVTSVCVCMRQVKENDCIY